MPNTTPQMIVEAMRKVMKESGLSRGQFEALAQIERTSLWKICTTEDEKYLPNLGTCLAILLASARLKKPQRGRFRLLGGDMEAWAENTILSVEELMALHEEARKYSRRQTSEHRAVRLPQQPETRPPTTSITRSQQHLPDWITSESM